MGCGKSKPASVATGNTVSRRKLNPYAAGGETSTVEFKGEECKITLNTNVIKGEEEDARECDNEFKPIRESNVENGVEVGSPINVVPEKNEKANGEDLDTDKTNASIVVIEREGDKEEKLVSSSIEEIVYGGEVLNVGSPAGNNSAGGGENGESIEVKDSSHEAKAGDEKLEDSSPSVDASASADEMGQSLNNDTSSPPSSEQPKTIQATEQDEKLNDGDGVQSSSSPTAEVVPATEV